VASKLRLVFPDFVTVNLFLDSARVQLKTSKCELCGNKILQLQLDFWQRPLTVPAARPSIFPPGNSLRVGAVKGLMSIVLVVAGLLASAWDERFMQPKPRYIIRGVTLVKTMIHDALLLCGLRLLRVACWLVECCFTSTETVGLLGTGAQDGHLDFYTAPGLCMSPVSATAFNTSRLEALTLHASELCKTFSEATLSLVWPQCFCRFKTASSFSRLCKSKLVSGQCTCTAKN